MCRNFEGLHRKSAKKISQKLYPLFFADGNKHLWDMLARHFALLGRVDLRDLLLADLCRHLCLSQLDPYSVLTLGKLSGTRSRQISQPNTRWKTHDKIYQIYMCHTPLHLSDLNNSANYRHEF